jgi:hypothetical protein
LGQPPPGQRITGDAFGVDRIGLGSGPPDGSLGPIQFDDQLLSVSQVSSQAGAVAAGALHRPGPQARVLPGQGDEFCVAVRVGRDRRSGQHSAGPGVDDRGGVGLAVDVDADDDLDQLCQHGHAFSSCQMGRSRSGSGAEMAGL